MGMTIDVWTGAELSSALSSAVAGDTVRLEAGTYTHSSHHTISSKAISITCASSGAGDCTLDGEDSRKVLMLMSINMGTCNISDVTITRAWTSNINGPGAKLTGSTAAFTRVRFIENGGTGNTFGAGMYTNSATVTLDECEFTGNTLVFGKAAGLFVGPGSVVTVVRTVFKDNVVTSGYGGAIFCASVLDLYGVIFSNNEVSVRRAILPPHPLFLTLACAGPD
jgi:hypothetical protein